MANIKTNSYNPLSHNHLKSGHTWKTADDQGFKEALRVKTQTPDIKKLEEKPVDRFLKPPVELPEVQFSGHAIERMKSRGLSFGPDRIHKISEALFKAEQKGAKEALIMSDDAAIIASVENNTIVTVMDRANLKENIFTNIDSAIFI